MQAERSTANQLLRVAMLARVVYPIHGFGGIERHVFHLITHLERLDVRIRLYVQLPPNLSDTHSERSASSYDNLAMPVKDYRLLRYDYTSPILRPNSIPGRQLNYPWYTWQLGLAAAAAVRQGEVHLVHSQGLCATGYGALRHRDPLLSRIPFVANPHGMEEFRTPDWRKWLAYTPFRWLYAYGHRCADRVIATDACTRHDVPRYLRVDPARVVVIPSAIDVEECLGLVQSTLRADLRQRFALTTRFPRLLSVGRLERNKGYHILIAALARLHPTLPPDWHWLLVGQGKEEQHLRQQAQMAGIASHITFTGRLDDAELHSLYEEIDLVIHPTLYEGSSLVTLEGMIHRRPVIASATGGIPDKVFPGRNGYLVRPGDVDDLAIRLHQALQQVDQWPHWGAESVRIVNSTFAWPVVARKTRDLYEEMWNER
ncbi:MAG: glycosyltransferase family 4 protein [Chloroflexaceae bacterium]|nr:glycosyltransferase family 4 protein [Chloroflexaceae bacterium]